MPARSWRWSPRDHIHNGHIEQLQVACIQQPGEIKQRRQSSPIALDGILDLSTSSNRSLAVYGATARQRG